MGYLLLVDMKSTTAIIVAVIGMVIISGIIYVGIFVVDKVQSNAYCDNWAANIEQRKSQANSGFWANIGTDFDALNADINSYNRECAF